MTAAFMHQVPCGSLAHWRGLRVDYGLLACFTQAEDAIQEMHLRALRPS